MPRNIINVISVIDYIERNLAEKLDLETISQAVSYSKYHLHRVFTATVGVTIHDYIQRRKLTEAAKLLVFSDRPIMEISLIAGYESQQAFTTVFKEMYKKTPHQYREDEEFYALQLRYTLNENPTKSGAEIDWRNDIRFATQEDVPRWMELVRLVVDGFPNLQTDEYRETLSRYIQDNQALLLKDQDTAIGIMLFNHLTGSIDFLGIHPQYHKRGIANAFLQKAMEILLPTGEDLSITTFRKGDKADPGQRKTLEGLGFAEGELLVEFGYPTQRMILKNNESEA